MRFRTITLVLLVVFVSGGGYAGPPRLALFGRDARIAATPLALPAGIPRKSGRLTWLGGVRLASPDPAFGGFSAMSVAGDAFTLLSDGGNIATFRMGPDWRIRDAGFAELPAGPSTGWEKRDRDSEALTLDPATGRAWVAFESANAIWRYAPGLARGEAAVRPPAMAGWAANGGPESFVRLASGRFVTIAETDHWPGQRGRAGIVFADDPVARPDTGLRFTYHPAPGFEPDDIAELPSGDLLVLERRWQLPLRFTARLAIVPRTALRRFAQVRGTELGRIGWPDENYEALAITREAGATIVWLASDNDQSWWRGSYLLKFRLD